MWEEGAGGSGTGGREGHPKSYSITVHTLHSGHRLQRQVRPHNKVKPPPNKCMCIQQCRNASLTSYASLHHLTDINTHISTSELILKMTFPWMHE